MEGKERGSNRKERGVSQKEERSILEIHRERESYGGKDVVQKEGGRTQGKASRTWGQKSYTG